MLYNDFHIYLLFKLFKTISISQNPSKGNFQLYTIEKNKDRVNLKYLLAR
jgi:hypothetical protein